MTLDNQSTRATLSVPAPSPETSMSLGTAWSGTPWNSDGFCANSNGRIWLDANGTTTASSTLGTLANNGQLLMQSLEDCIYMISNESAVVATNGGAFLAGGGGVKLMAGHGAPSLFVPNESTLANIKPDEVSPSSEHAAAYTDYMDDVATAWTITDTVMAGLLTALDIGLTIADCYKGGSPGGLGASLLLLGSAANLAGGAVNIAGMSGEHLPGLNMHAVSNITLATTGFCSIYSGAGMLLCGLTTTGTGFLTAGVTASVNAALKSLAMSTVEGKKVELVGMKETSVGARTAQQKIYGETMLFGSKGGEAKTQLPTLSIEASSIKSTDLISQLGDIQLTTGGDVTHDSDLMEIDGTKSIQIKGPTYKVVVSPKGIELTFSGTTKVKMDPKSLEASASAMSLQMTNAGIKLGAGASNLDAKVAGTWKWTSPAFTFL